MMQTNIKHAVIAAITALVLAFPILGVKLELKSGTLVISPEFMHAAYAAGAVFLLQLFASPLQSFSKNVLPSVQIVAPAQSFFDKNKVWILALVILVLFVMPFFSSRGFTDIFTLAIIYILLGLGLNIVVGFAGLLDLGYVGFYAVGAYSYALLAQAWGLGFWEALLVCGFITAIVGILLGFPVLRLRGDYLAIVTLGFGEIIRILLNNLDHWTGGPNGISSIPKPTLFGLEFTRRASEGSQTFHEFFGLEFSSEYRVIFLYFIGLFMVLVSLWAINRLIRMPVGRAWEALREDEIACRSLGLNPTAIKLSAFAIGATFAGFSGAFFAAKQGFINPESFTFIESAIVLAIVVLGGMGSQSGVILAAIALTILPELARGFESYRMLIFGLVMVLMMIWRPQGLIPAKRPQIKLPKAKTEGGAS